MRVHRWTFLIIITIGLMLGVNSIVLGQITEPPIKRLDSLQIKAWSKLIFEDTFFIIKKDTVLYDIPESLIEVKPRKFAQFFHNVILVDQPIIETPQRSISEEQLRGREVDTTILVKLEASGTDIMRPDQKVDNWVTKALNKSYIKTTDFFLRNNLLYDREEEITDFSLDDTERHLRSFLFIKDARLDAVIDPADSTKIDVIAITKDVWPYRPRLRIGFFDRFDLGIEYINVAGLGHSAFVRGIFEEGEKPGYEVAYQIPNILSSLNIGEFAYVDRKEAFLIGGAFRRNFLYPEQKYGGGASYFRSEFNDLNYFEDRIDTAFIGVRQPDFWIARSFPVNIHLGYDNSRSSIVTGLRLLHEDFYIVEGVDIDENPQYQDSYILVGSIAFHNRSYFKDNLLLGFGRTEDVPQGQRFAIDVGYEFGEETNRLYTGLSLRHAYYWRNFGYANAELSIGSFWNDGKTEQGAIAGSFSYFTKLLGKKRYRYRYNISAAYQIGVKLAPNEIIDITDQNGLRGLNTRQLLGGNRFNVNNTLIAYTPWQPFGFQCALLGFFDIGFIAQEDRSIFTNAPIYGLGLGVQFNNENFIIGTILFGFAYYVNDPGGDSFSTFSSTSGQVFFSDLEGRKPRIISIRDIE